MLTVKDLYDLSHSLAGDYLAQFTYPWEALAGISDLILEIGKQLPQEEYYHPADWDGKVLEDVWVAKDATVFKTAYLHGPLHHWPSDGGAPVRLYPGAAHWWETTAWWATPQS